MKMTTDSCAPVADEPIICTCPEPNTDGLGECQNCYRKPLSMIYKQRLMNMGLGLGLSVYRPSKGSAR